jgi:chorismate dehydratase
MEKLKIGRIPYANLFPIYYTLEREFDCSAYEFVEGAPSKLNKMLREGQIDVCPSSSVEYLRNPDLYNIIDDISVSSKGKVGSVILFTRRPIETISGKKIMITDQSDTSVALLDIILKRFYEYDYESELSDAPHREGKNYFLMIGDDALRHAHKEAALDTYQTECDNADANPLQCLEPPTYVYDLGEIWYRQTGLPFVFALWTAGKRLYEPNDPHHNLFKRFSEDLLSAKDAALRNLNDIAQYSSLKPQFKDDEILAYWKLLDYDLGEEHKKGLALFKETLGL